MDALAVGSLYALIALGYTMVYGILKFINFAHSDVFVLGAWTAYRAALCAGWTNDGVPEPIARWVLWILGLIAAVGLVLAIVGRTVIKPPPGALGQSGPARAGSTMLAVGVWGWACVGLVLLARVLKSGGMEYVGGGVILLLAMGTCGVVGFCIERLAYKPLRKAPRLNVLITAIGVSLLLQNVGQLDWMFGTQPARMPSLVAQDKPLLTILGTPNADGSISGGVNVWLVDVIGAGTAIILMIALDRLVFQTKIGRAMRAVSYNPTTAALMGIPVDRVISFTFVLGAVLAAAAGFLYTQKYPGLLQPATGTWVLLGLKAFVAAVVGGIGNIRGAMAGGLLIGLIEFFGVGYVSTEYRDVYVFGLLIVVLLVRPSGLLGKAVAEKV